MTLGPLESRPLDPVWVVSVCMCVARAAPSDADSRVPRLSARTRVCLPLRHFLDTIPVVWILIVCIAMQCPQALLYFVSDTPVFCI